MGALVTEKDVLSARAITAEEWARMRRESIETGVTSAGSIAATLDAVLLKYQQRLLATTAMFRVTVVEKSRRTGATWGVAADAVLTAASARSAGGMDALYIGYNLDMGREFIDTCAMWARAFDEAIVEGGVAEFLFDDGPDKSISAFRIRFASGFEIVALSSRSMFTARSTPSPGGRASSPGMSLQGWATTVPTCRRWTKRRSISPGWCATRCEASSAAPWMSSGRPPRPWMQNGKRWSIATTRRAATCKQNRMSAGSRKPGIAPSATLALKAGLWLRLLMVSPVHGIMPLSGRNSTYPGCPVFPSHFSNGG